MMQCSCAAELTDLFAEHYQADIDDPDYLVSDQFLNGNIDIDDPALTSVNAAVPAKTRAVLGEISAWKTWYRQME